MKKEDGILLKLVLILGIQFLFAIIIDNSFVTSFISSVGTQEQAFNEFVDAFNQCLVVNQKMFMLSILLSIGIQGFVLIVRKQYIHKSLYMIFIALIFIDFVRIYEVVTGKEYYQTYYLLNRKAESLNNLRVRTYLYHYFKIKGDVKGMNMVIDLSTRYLNPDDMAYLVQHRKDKKFDNIVNPEVKSE